MKHALKRGGSVGSSLRSTGRRCLLLLSILSLLTLSTGCGGSLSLPPVEVNPVQVETPPEKPTLPDPEPIQTLPVEWQVIETEDGPLLALPPKEFENLATNLAEILRWIQEAAWRLHYYGKKAE
jgi:hypothetical protein